MYRERFSNQRATLQPDSPRFLDAFIKWTSAPPSDGLFRVEMERASLEQSTTPNPILWLNSTAMRLLHPAFRKRNTP